MLHIECNISIFVLFLNAASKTDNNHDHKTINKFIVGYENDKIVVIIKAFFNNIYNKIITKRIKKTKS